MGAESSQEEKNREPSKKQKMNTGKLLRHDTTFEGGRGRWGGQHIKGRTDFGHAAPP